MKILFLHLSDLHLRDISDVSEKCIFEIPHALSSQNLCSVESIFLLITGDIGYSGLPKQYVAFETLLSKLKDGLKDMVSEDTSIHVFCVPGNHDIDYRHICNKTRMDYENLIVKNVCPGSEEAQARATFFDFSQSGGWRNSSNPFLCRTFISIGEFSVEVNLLDTTLFSLKEANDQGLHIIPFNTIDQLRAPTGANMAITLMHHSHQWFNENCKNELEKALMEKNTMIFVGHEHYLAQQSVVYNGAAPAHIFCGGSLCNYGNWLNSEFFACMLDVENETYSYYAFHWNQQDNIYHSLRKADGSISLKGSTSIPCRINQEFIQEIKDDSHIKLPASLSDYYVFPGLERSPIDDNDLCCSVQNFSSFYRQFEKDKRLELAGSDGIGKSSLLKMIFNHYVGRKCVLLCRVNDITSGNRKRIIKNLFESVYGEEEYDKFLHLDKKDKMILIDDLHLISPQHVSDFLNGIENEFGYIIYTTSNMLKLDIADRIKASLSKNSFVSYRLLPLGKERRKQLVEKVLPLKLLHPTPEDVAAFTEKITQVLLRQRRYIPLTPETVIQFIEYYVTYQLDAAQNDGNIFGKVFEASIVNALTPHVKLPITVDKAFAVLGKIAFHIHLSKSYPISDKEIIDVINNYCEEYGCTMSSVDFIASVSNANILHKHGEGGFYKFCNNNYLAYFIASEICAARDKVAVENCLRCSCFGINSTILMFVTYLTNDLDIINAIYNFSIAITSLWEEFSFGMKELSHINGVTSNQELLAPSNEEREADCRAEDEKDRAEIENATISVVDIYDYDEAEAENLDNLILTSLSLLLLLARCLPNFEHRLKKEQKKEIVKALYELPNKIFWVWAGEVEKYREDLIHLISSMETNEYSRQKLQEGNIETFIQWHSLSLLLELYYGVMSNSYRENTVEYLLDMAESCVDFEDKSTHMLERLIVLTKKGNASNFISLATKLQNSIKEPAALLTLQRIVRRVLLNSKLTPQQSSELTSKFFPDIRPSARIIQQYSAQKED